MAIFIQQMCLLVLCYWIIPNPTCCVSSSACGTSSGEITIEPSLAVMKEEDVIDFTCRVKTPSTDYIVWNINPDMNNTDVSVLHDPDGMELISTLTVHVVQTVQFFSCDMVSSPDQRVCFSSGIAQLRVQYFPKKKDISCGPRDPDPLHNGEKLEIYCQVLRSNPAVDMRWKLLPDTTILSLSPYRDRSVYRVLSHELSVTEDLHMKKLLCEVTSELIFPYRLLQCSIGPIKVYQSPKAIVLPLNAEIIVDRPTEFSCIVDGYPDEFTFTWSCLPRDILDGCDSVSETAEISYLVDYVVGFEAKIICAVSNSIGRAIASSHIKLLPFNMKSSIPSIDQTTLPPMSHHDNITLKISWQLINAKAPNRTAFTFSCSVENSILRDGADIQWYLGENKLTADISYRVTSFNMFKSEITLFNVCGKDYDQELYCLVVVGNVTHKSSSVNIAQVYQRRRTINLTSDIHPDSISTQNARTDKISLMASTDQSLLRSDQVSRREFIIFALCGALASVIIITSVVTLLLVILYRRFKMANMNHTCIPGPEKDIQMGKQDSTSGVPSDSEPVYHIPLMECDSTPSCYTTHMYPICSDRNSDSSGNFQSNASSSPGCSSSNASSGYLEPDAGNISIDIHPYVVSEK